MARCRHRRTQHRRWIDGAWADIAHGFNCAGWIGAGDASVVCKDCGAWLSLGPSDETDERVALEILAAAIVAGDARCPVHYEDCQWCGLAYRILNHEDEQ